MTPEKQLPLGRSMPGSILRRLRWSMMGFGLAMGVVFPAYANLFVVWKPGMFPFFAAGAVMAGVVVGLANHLMMKTILLKPLHAISRVAQSLRLCDLRSSTDISSDDEVGAMANDLDLAMHELSRTIGSVREAMRVVETAVGKVDQSRAQAHSSLEGIANTAGSIAIKADDDLDSIESASRSIDEISRWMQNLSIELSESAAEMVELKTRSLRTVEDSTLINGHLEEFSSHIGGISTSAKTIEGLMAMVATIVRQTEILSLNASIEAVRAGEHGKGFSVVASEIRALAHDSAQAGTKIGAQIISMRSSIAQTEAGLSWIRDAMSENLRLASDLSESVAVEEQKLSARSDSSKSASDTAATGTVNILQATESIRGTVARLHRMEGETQASRQDLSRMSEDVETLGNQVNQLGRLTGSFQT